MTEHVSRIEKCGVEPSIHDRCCVICGEKFGPQCFGAVVAADISESLDGLLTARELCNRCGDRQASAIMAKGSLGWVGLVSEWQLHAWWQAFRWYWPRRHEFDNLKYPSNAVSLNQSLHHTQSKEG